jgi:hypothetical protein
VWPLFTGWASVGEYRYHQALPAYANLRSNALLALDGSLGHVTEVLSGDYYQQISTSSPHQIWSAAMVISPILRGMFGLGTDAQAHIVTFAPHVPADWRAFTLNNLRAGATNLAVSYKRSPGLIVLEVKRTGSGDGELDFSPALSLRTEVTSVELNGHSLPFHVSDNDSDRHVAMKFPVTQETSTVRIRLKNDFGVSLSNTLPALGAASEGLRVLSERWNSSHTQLTLSLSGLAGKTYELSICNPAQIASVKGGKIGEVREDQASLTIEFPLQNPAAYAHQDVVLNFAGSK